MRRPPCSVSSRHEDAFGCAHVQVHVVVERRAEAVQEGDDAEPWASGRGGAGVTRHACGSAQQPQADRRENPVIASARRSPTVARSACDMSWAIPALKTGFSPFCPVILCLLLGSPPP